MDSTSPDALPASFRAAEHHPDILRAVLLHRAQGLWRVESGHVDVFALDAADGPARLHPLLRLAAGEGFSGLAPVWVAGAHPPLVAVPTPGTHLADGAEVVADALALVDLWISRLIAAGPCPLPPRGAQLLHPQFDATLPKDAVVCAGEPLLWLVTPAPLTGAEGTPSGPGIVPLTPDFWLSAPETTKVRVLDTAHLPDPATQAACQKSALGLALARIATRLAAETAQAGADLARREAIADRRLQSAARSMAGLLSPKPRTPEAEASDDALMIACRRAAGHDGIVLQAAATDASGRGADAPQARIEALARASRVRVRPARLAEGWWRGDGGAFVALDEDGTPVALVPALTGYRLHHPTRGEMRVDGRLAARLAPVAFTFYRPFPEGPLNRRAMLAFAGARNLGGLITILAASLCAACLALLTPLVTGHIFDTIIPRAETEALHRVLIVLVAAACAGLGFGTARALTQLRLRGRVDAVVQSAVWDRLLRLPATFFQRYEVGDLMSRAAGINTISNQLAGSTLTALFSGVFALVSFAMMVYYQPLVAMVGLALVLLVVASGVLFAWLQLMTQRTQYALRGRLSSRVFQLITGIQVLRANHAERLAFWDWSRLFVQDLRFQIRSGVLGYSQSLFSSGMMILFQVSALALFAFYTHGTSTGTFIAFNSAFGQFFGGLSGFAGALVSLFALAPLYERTEPILSADPEVGHGRADPGELTGRIRLESVSFAYQASGRTVIDDVTLDIRSGEFIAIVGASGSGKSTLMRLLLGFATPTRGSVSYDGHDLAKLDLSAVRRQLGVVLQNGMLLPGTILDNIVANGAFSLEEAWQAARDAGLEADLKAMPMGLQTPVSEGGATFSGGQKQRLLIARAIIRKPRILLFDEATSALDNLTQAHVSAALDRMRTTRIVIAHRLSTIARADRIVLLDGGRVAESGNYAALMAQGGAFAALAGRQIA